MNKKTNAAETPYGSPPELCEFAAKMIRQRMERMLSEAEGACRGATPEPIHQMRVWSRRSRAALEIFAPCFSGKEYLAIEQEIRAVTGALGAARDLDVMILTMRERAASLPEAQRQGTMSFVTKLEKERKKAQPAVRRTVDRLEKRDILQEFKALTGRDSAQGKPHKNKGKNAPVMVDPDAPLLTNAAKTIRKRLIALTDYESCLAEATRVREHHAMRIAAKRLRYTMDIFQDIAPLYMPDPADYVNALNAVKSFQDHLGVLHDCDVLVPQLTAQLTKITRDGYGMNGRGEPIVGVHCLDWNACEGLLTLCRETVLMRDERFVQLQKEWQDVKAAQTFDRLRSALNQISKHPIFPAPARAETVSDISLNDSAVSLLSAPNIAEDTTDHEEAQPKTDAAAGSAAARPRARSSRITGHDAPAAAHTRRRSGTGADTPAGFAEGGPEQPGRPENSDA